MRILGLSIFFVIGVCTASAQDPSGSFEHPGLKKARNVQAEGDLLLSANMLSFIALSTEDSLLGAESLYRLIELGDAVRDRMNRRLRQGTPLYSVHPDSARVLTQRWRSQRSTMSDPELDVLRGLGIDIAIRGYDSSEYRNYFSSVVQQMKDKYPGTKWTEKARAEGIWMLESYSKVIAEGESFLEQYPESEYIHAVYAAVACAYTDKWIVETEESEEFGEYRNKAIDLYKKAIASNTGKKVATVPLFIMDYGKALKGLEASKGERSLHVCFIVM